MKKILNFVLSVFFVAGLLVPISSVFAQDPANDCTSHGGTWTGTTCNFPTNSPAPSPSSTYTPPATQSPSPTTSTSASPSPSPSYSCPPPQPSTCGSGYQIKTITPTSGCPYNNCEPATGVSPSPTTSTSSSQCTSSAPGYCSSPATCQGAGNYWCGGSSGSGPCVQTSAAASCPPVSGSSPSPTYSPGQSPYPSGSCPPPQPSTCGSGYQIKTITPTSGCPYNNCEPATGVSPSPTYSPGQSPYPSQQQCKTGEYFDFGKNSCVPFAQQQQCQPPQYFDYRANQCVEPLKCAPDEHPEPGPDGKTACVKGGTSFGGKQACNAPPGCAVFPDQFGGCRYDCSNLRPTGCQKTEADLAREKADFEKSCGGNVRLEQVDQFCKGYVCDFNGGGYFNGGGNKYDYSKFSQQGQFPQGGQPGYFGAGQQGPGFFQQSASFCEPAEQLKSKQTTAEAGGKMQCFIENVGGCDQLKCFPKDQAQNFNNANFAGPGGCTTKETCDKFCSANPTDCQSWAQQHFAGDSAGQSKVIQNGKFNFEVSDNAKQKCIQSGGDIFEKRNDKGELDAFDCVHSPQASRQTRKAIKPTEKIPSSIEIAGVLLQIEELKVSILGLGEKVKALTAFYKDQADQTNTIRFEKASDKFATAANNVDIVRAEIKALVETSSATGLTGKQIAATAVAKKKITTHTMDDIRSKIKEKVEGPLEDAVFILVGSDKEVEKVVSNKADDKTVANDEEFKSEMEWRIQNCKPGKVTADFTPEGAPSSVKISMEGDIKGLATNGNCEFAVKGTFPSFENGKISAGKEQSMSCSLPENVYAAANIDEAGDEILKDCSGALVDTLKQSGSPQGPGGGQGPQDLIKLSQDLGGSGSPEDLKQLCSESQDSAKKCLTVLTDFNQKNPGMVPAEALTGLKYLAEGTAPPSSSGGFPGGGATGGNFPGGGATGGSFPSGGQQGFQGLPPECQAAGATTPSACEAIMRQKFGGNGPQSGFGDQGRNSQGGQSAGQNFNPQSAQPQNFNQPPTSGGFNQPPPGGV